nr:type II CRISPR RNA-guided endonuclease Cas9 [Pacificimonas pallii]
MNSRGRTAAILDGGVRIYSDGREAKSGTSLAVDRRNARAARRRRDRYLRRREVLLAELVRLGLMPEDEAERQSLKLVDPYEIRAQALTQAVPPAFLGRALFHLNQRRGFKSNRKAERGSDEDLGIVAQGHETLDDAMAEAGAKTFGQFLAMRHANSGRTRVRKADDEDGYAFYPARRHLEAEFAALWEAQARHHPDILTDEARDRLYDVIFYQRPLKAPEVGRCTYNDEPRMAKAHPLFQRLRLVKSINELTVELTGEEPRALTMEERDNILRTFRSATATKKSVTWGSLRKAAKSLKNTRFKGEEQRGKGLVGDEIEHELVKRLGPVWREFDLDRQWRIVERLLNEEELDVLVPWLMAELDVDDEQAREIAAARLPEGYGRVGPTAAAAILKELMARETDDGFVIPEAKAVELSPDLGHHSDFRTGEIFETLPYYGEILERNIPPGSQDPDECDEKRFGRITNPTVHIGMGQLRRVVNAIIAKHGKPAEIVVELARDLKLSEDDKKELNRRNAKNRDEAIRRGEKLQEIGVANNGRNRATLRLWEELHPDPKARVCIYTGTPIGIEMLFSGVTDIDHILPIRETLDDSGANQLVCMAAANRRKSNRTPYDAFGGQQDWEDIASRAAKLPPNKRWRFAPDALSRFADQGGFLARQLTDTQYLSRLAKDYLAALYPETGPGSQKVRVIPGRLTEMLRRQWGLNSLLPDHNMVGADVSLNKAKNRLDHRHHMIDAFVTAVTDQSLMQRVATAAGANDDQGLDNIFAGMPEPWKGFREDLERLVNRVTVSHKPDRGHPGTRQQQRIGRDETAGQLHNDTAYGLTGETDEKGNEIVVRRVPLLSLTNEKKIMQVRDPDLRNALWTATRGLKGRAWEQALRGFALTGAPGVTDRHGNPMYRGIRHVRVTEPLKTVKIRDRDGRAYKGYKGDANYRYDVWEMPDGKWVTKWKTRDGAPESSIITMYDAHQPEVGGQESRPHPAARRVLKLHQNDMVAFDHPSEGTVIGRVVKFGQNGQITLVLHREAGDLKRRDADADDPFKYYAPTAGGLKKANARQIRIDELGQVWDPGPPK